MYKIKNIETFIIVQAWDQKKQELVDKTVAVKHWDWIWGACNRVNPNEPANYDTFKKLGRIEELYKKAKNSKVNDVIEVDNEDFNFIKERVTSHSWGLYDKNLLAFIKLIDELKEEPILTKKK